MKPLHCLAWAGATLALAALIGCQGGSTGTAKPRVAFVSNNAESFWTIAEAGAKKSAADNEVELLFKMPSSGDASVQKEVIDTVEIRPVSQIDEVLKIALQPGQPKVTPAQIEASRAAVTPAAHLSNFAQRQARIRRARARRRGRGVGRVR